MNRASWETVKASGNPPASSGESSSGTGSAVRSWHDRKLGLRPATDHGHDPIADCEAEYSRPDGRDDAGELQARNVCRRARRGGIAAGPLEQVGAVQASGLDFDEKLTRSREPGRGVL